MKNLIITLSLLICFGQIARTQTEIIIWHAAGKEFRVKPMTESQSNQILENDVRDFLEPIANEGREEGVAAIKTKIDDGSNDQVNLTRVYNTLHNDYHLKNFKNTGNIFIHISALSDARSQGVLPIIPGRMITSDADIGPVFAMFYFKMPKGRSIENRAEFDIMKAYDLNPNELSVKGLLPDKMTKTFDKSAASSKRYFGLMLVDRGKGYKVYPGDVSKLIIDGDFGPVTGLKTTGDIQVKKSGQTMGFKGSDEELQAARRTADSFLKAISQNDTKGFEAAFGNHIFWSPSTTAFNLRKYRRLPEYVTHSKQFEQVIITGEGRNNTFIWNPALGVLADDVVINLENKALAVLYRLPEGRKASAKRAPTDIFNTKFYENPATQIRTTFPDIWSKKDSYISVVLHKDKGTNNFNIGMPPTVK